jgi:hypothetical protein
MQYYRPFARIYLFWHFWLATVHEVLQADWHEAWHSPQPTDPACCLGAGFFIVLICFIHEPPRQKYQFNYTFGVPL